MTTIALSYPLKVEWYVNNLSAEMSLPKNASATTESAFASIARNLRILSSFGII